MGRVEDLQTPLHTEEDCDRVRGKGVGKDNVDKLKEIVRTGAFRRNETLAKDPHHQAIKLVRGSSPSLSVLLQWGCSGPAMPCARNSAPGSTIQRRALGGASAR